MTDLERFLAQVSGSDELKSELEGPLEAREVVAIGKSHGYTFTEQEVNERAQQLSEEQLDAVSGGGDPAALRPSGARTASRPIRLKDLIGLRPSGA